MTGATRRILDALTYWGLVTCAVMSCSAGLASDVCACSKSKAYVTAMKSDLRNLVSAQEQYLAEHGRYASDSALRQIFRSSTGVTVWIEFADRERWHAHALHVAIKGICSIEGSATAASDDPIFHVPRCEIPPRTCRPNAALNTSVDLWLFAFTVRRRQRRRLHATTDDSAVTTGDTAGTWMTRIKSDTAEGSW